MSDRGLPNLIARLLLNRSNFTEGIAASIKEVAGLDAAASKGGTGLLGLGNAHGKAASSAKAHATEVRGLESALKDTERAVGIVERLLGGLGVSKESAIGRTAQQLAGVTGGLGPAGAAVGIGLGGAAATAGVGVFLDEMAKKQAELGYRVLATSQALGIESGQLQGLEEWGKRYNITAETMDQQLFMFQKNVGEGAPALKAQGIDIEKIGITSRDTATAYKQTADALSSVTDQGQRAIIVQGLFGKGGEQQLAALSQGSAAIDAYIQKLVDYGVILDKTTLQEDAAAKAAREDMGLAVQGLENQFVKGLEPAVATLDLVIQKLAINGKKGFQAIGEAVGTVIGDVASLVVGLFGLDPKEIQKGFDEANASMVKGTQATGAAFATTKGQAQAYQQQLAANVKELEREQHAYDLSIDTRVRGEQELQKELDLRVRLLDQQRTAEADAAAISKDEGEARSAAVLGDFLNSSKIGAQLTKDKQKQSDDQFKAGVDAAKRESQEKIDRWTEEKRVTDETYRVRIQQQQDLATAARTADTAIANDATFTTGKITVAWTGMKVSLNKQFEDLGVTIHHALFDPFDDKKAAELAGKAEAMGLKVGGALMTGIVNGIQNHAVDDQHLSALQNNLGSLINVAAILSGSDIRSGSGMFSRPNSGSGNTATVGTHDTTQVHEGHAYGGVLREPILGFGLTTGNVQTFSEKERVLSASEAADYERRKGVRGDGGDVNIYLPNYIGNERAVADVFTRTLAGMSR